VAKFNFLAHRGQPTDIKVKQPAKHSPARRDPFAGLYGPDYIAANSLKAPAEKVQTSAQGDDHA